MSSRSCVNICWHCTGCRSTSVLLKRSLYWHTKLVHLQRRHICQTCFIPWHLRVRRGLSTPGDYKLNGLVLSSAGALSLSQHQQCGTHYLPNKDSAVPYRLLRNIWREDALVHQRFLASVTYCQRLCILGHNGAIEIVFFFYLIPSTEGVASATHDSPR